MVGRRRRDVGHAVVGGHAVGLQHLFHPGLLQLELLGQRLDQRHLAVGVQARLGQRQRRGGAEVAGAIGACAAAALVGLQVVLHQRELARRVAVRLGDACEPVARLHRRLQRLGVLFQVGLVGLRGRGARAALLGRLLVQLRGLPLRGTRSRRRLGCNRQALVLAGRLGPAALLHIDDRQLAADLRLQRVRGEALAEVLERAGRAVPVLQADQRGRGVVLRGRPHGRLRRDGGHPCEMVDRLARLPGGAGLFALLVDRRGLAFHQFAAASGLLRRQRDHLAVAALGAVEGALFEGGVREHGPRDPALLGGGRRLQVQHLLRHHGGRLGIAQRIELLGGVAQHGADARIAVEGLRELQRAGHRRTLQRRTFGRRGLLLELRMAEQRRIAGVGALRVGRVLVGRLLVLGHGLGVARVLVQQLGEQEVVGRRIGIGRERLEPAAVPAHRLLVVGRAPALLRARVIVARQLGQVGLDQRLRAFPALRVGAAELAGRAVAGHVLLLRLQRQVREAGLLVDLDHARLQHRRLRVQRLAPREGAEGVGRVLGALLLDVELAELLVDAELVAAPHVAGDVGRDRFGALQILQAQAGDTEGVLDEFAVGAAQVSQAGEVVVSFVLAQREVEHAEERAQRLLEPALLEARPALHVQRTALIGAVLVAVEHGAVGLLGLRVVAHREQQLATAEMGLVAVGRLRVVLNQPVEGLERHFQLAALLLGARQLVEHAVVARVLGVGLQVALVAGDRRTVVRPAGRGGLDAALVGALHLQVAQAAHRFRALRRTGRHLEKLAVGGDRLLLAGGDADVLLHADLAAGQAAQRRLVVGRAAALAGAGTQPAGDQQGQQQATTTARVHGRPPSRAWRGRATGRPRSGPG